MANTVLLYYACLNCGMNPSNIVHFINILNSENINECNHIHYCTSLIDMPSQKDTNGKTNMKWKKNLEESISGKVFLHTSKEFTKLAKL